MRAGLWLRHITTHKVQVMPAVAFSRPPASVLAKHGPALSSDHEVYQTVSAVLSQLVSSIPRMTTHSICAAPACTLLVRDSNWVDACCLEGTIVISTGLVEMIRRQAGTQRMPAQSVDIIAAVLGHEVGHLLTRKLKQRDSVIASLGAGALGGSAVLFWGLGPLTIASLGLPLAVCWFALVQRQFREQELAADAVCVRLLHAAGYDVRALEAFFRSNPSSWGVKDASAEASTVISTGSVKDACLARLADEDPSGFASLTPSGAAIHAARRDCTDLESKLGVAEPGLPPWLVHRWQYARHRVLQLPIFSSHPPDAARADAAAALAIELQAEPQRPLR